MDKTLYFVSKNRFKHAEAQKILAPSGVRVESVDVDIAELQTIDTVKLVKDKATKAFEHVGRRLFVEHTGLYLDLLGGFPGGLTQIFWDTLRKDRFSSLFASEESKVIARTTIAYVDGKRMYLFEGETTGKIVSPPRVDHGFQWDCVFVPEGYQDTFSEMGDKKNEISMRRQALERLCDHLSSEL